MESEWYLKVADKEVGPLTPRQLKSMADRDQISPYDPVRLGIDGHWVPASSVRGLLPPAASGGKPDAEPKPGTEPKPATGGKPADAPTATLPGTALPGIPMAQPVARPVAPPVARPVAAMLTPQASDASSPGLFAVEAGEDTLVSRYAGRHHGWTAGSHKRRKQEALIVAGVMVLMALSAVSAAVMLLGKGATSTSRGPKPADNVSRDVEPEHEEVVIPGLAEYLGEVGLDGADSPFGSAASGRPRSESSAAGSWTDASTSSAECGDVSVKITSAEIDRPRLTSRSSGMAARATKDYLCVKLELGSRNQDKELEYRSWSVEGAGVTLVDDRGTRYPMKSFAPRGLEIDGQIEGGKVSLLPGQVTQEMLVFERPATGAARLRLQLPASAWGDEGSLKFEIPISMIAVADAPQESGLGGASDLAAEGTAEGRAAPEPGTAQATQPVYDRGPIPIPGVTGEPSREAADDASSGDEPKLP